MSNQSNGVKGTQNTSASSSRRQPNRLQRITQPGTKTSRRSHRTSIQDIPRLNFDEDEGVTAQRLFDKFKDPTEECQEFHALLWRAESLRGNPNISKKAFLLCCNNGKVLVAKAPDTPEPLLDLFLNDDAKRKNSINNIRTYNSMFSFTINRRGRSPFVFRLREQNYHKIDNEVENRASAIRNISSFSLLIYSSSLDQAGPSNERHPIDTKIIGDVRDIMDGCNKLVETFRMSRDRYNEKMEQSIKINLITKRAKDGRTYKW
ncbi:hypothetical protein Tco_0852179 [Tanacetum coccineum]